MTTIKANIVAIFLIFYTFTATNSALAAPTSLQCGKYQFMFDTDSKNFSVKRGDESFVGETIILPSAVIFNFLSHSNPIMKIAEKIEVDRSSLAYIHTVQISGFANETTSENGICEIIDTPKRENQF